MEERGWASRQYNKGLSNIQQVRIPCGGDIYQQLKVLYRDLRNSGGVVFIHNIFSIKVTMCLIRRLVMVFFTNREDGLKFKL